MSLWITAEIHLAINLCTPEVNGSTN
uniref:Uncharacterized protein n=1 Tax=Arundo donax TaxID=35708 RepID=A0A0A9EMS8_ARUDO